MRGNNPTPPTIERLVLDGGVAPIAAPLNIRPSAAPTSHVDGDIYVDTNYAVRLSNGTSLVVPGNVRKVFHAATTLTAADSGALCVWDTAAGFLYTLPAAAEGLWFDFVVAVTITSSAAKVICAAGDFILGSFLQIPDTAAQAVYHAANGTTHVAWSGNGTTTGGYSGDSFRLTAISGTQWVIHNGIGLATGSEATPFATS